ncbi:hypothetical protein BC826DRAFT_1189361 [Russula brevipes]|nr:hypothetical protein BC826DRAFT_1189361 [Russula brevipes]
MRMKEGKETIFECNKKGVQLRLVKGKGEDQIPDELELGSIVPHRYNFRFLKDALRNGRHARFEFGGGDSEGVVDSRRRNDGANPDENDDILVSLFKL